MARIAFTIILNGLHHLKHNNYLEYLNPLFDKWVFVDGAVHATGSTGWCVDVPQAYHNNGKSIDGTVEFLKTFKNVTVVECNSVWPNKDEKVNAAIDEIRKTHTSGFLWQIDADEQWDIGDIIDAEDVLILEKARMARFECNYFVGPGLIAKGIWGEGSGVDGLKYNRLWNWSGEYFKSHEPPELYGGNGIETVLPQRFNHYAYYFEDDVKFKQIFYKDSVPEDLIDRWKSIQNGSYPKTIKDLLGETCYGQTNTTIEEIC